MAKHRFTIGKVVDTTKDRFGIIPPGPHEVVRQLPPAQDGISQYRVRSLRSGQERVVREDQLLTDAVR